MDVSFVVVTYKTAPDVRRACFERIAKSTDVSWECIVVENSGDSSVLREVSQVMTKATCIINQKHRVLSCAIAQGARIAKGKYVLVVHPEALFEPDFVAKTLVHVEVAKEIGSTNALFHYPAKDFLWIVKERFEKKGACDERSLRKSMRKYFWKEEGFFRGVFLRLWKKSL